MGVIIQKKDGGHCIPLPILAPNTVTETLHADRVLSYYIDPVSTST